MDTALLETLIAVAEGGSVAAAARRQGLTPTSVTQRVRALEAALGARLAVRVGREVRLTAAGEGLLERARRVVGEVAGLAGEIVTEPDGVLRGTVRLGAISTALTGLLPPVMGRWAREHPEVSLAVSPGTSSDLFDGLLGGRYDAVVGVEPPFTLPKTIRTRALRREPLVLLAPARVTSDMDDPDVDAAVRAVLGRERFIRYDVASWGGRICERYLRDKGIAVSEFCSLDGLEAIALLVDQGVGAALVPNWTPPWPALSASRRLLVSDRTYARSILLAHPANTRHGPVLARLASALSQPSSAPGLPETAHKRTISAR